jgi:hypothetical protein
MDHLEDLLAGAATTLDNAVLDPIDEIVLPGTSFGPLDAACTPPAITSPALRRRATDERAAA